MENMLTVKEWAKKAGLHLYNYDGFVKMYERISNKTEYDFETYIANRMRNAGELLCTRRAFQAGLSGCTINFPAMSQYEEMSDVIPDFVETSINISMVNISRSISYSKDIDLRANIEQLLELLRLKSIVREKSIKINGVTDKVNISDLDENALSPKSMEFIKKYNGTVEDLEINLINEIISDLEHTLGQKRLKLSKVADEKIHLLASLLYVSARNKCREPSENEYMYVEIPGMPKEPFMQTYTIIEKDSKRTGVAFDIQTEDGRVRGSMPTTPEMDKKIKAKMGIHTDETSKSLEIIDSQVKSEERRGFMERLEELVKNIINKLRGDKEGR